MADCEAPGLMIWVLIAIAVILAILCLISFANRRFFIGLFSKGNVIVTGLRGRGKDMAFCIVINARKRNYISNVRYSDPKRRFSCIPFDANVWKIGGNEYKNFADGTVKKFKYPYPDNTDYFISDAGVYYPAQYATELVKRYSGAPLFQALSRHLGNANVHCNVQNLNRLWDKLREQSDLYVCMKGCKVLFGKFAFLRGSVYEKAESCEARLSPPHFGIGKEAQNRRVIFEAQNGKIKNFWFIAKVPYRYDDRRFKRMLEMGVTDFVDGTDLDVS